MGDFSRDTSILNRLKRYVGVRLQEGVPLIDADWNEQEDIRKFEVQAFLKWYVGNGVPKGNDGFRIMPVKDKIILSSTKDALGMSSVYVKWKDSTASGILGFGSTNYCAERMAPPAAQLIGEKAAEPKDGKKVYFDFGDGKTLKISGNGSDLITVTLSDKLTPEQVADEINNEINKVQKFPRVKAEAGKLDDFIDFIIKGPIIKGPNDPLTDPGRCLVDGLDVTNETDLTYSSQGLDPINIPSSHRTDTVYLDVWEREVNSNEDPDLIDNRIGIETCVRLKRDWVVRVAQGVANGENSDQPPAGHVYYDLARLNWKQGEMEIQDLRCKGLAVLSEEITIEDGNVGIGTTDPETKLEVMDGSAKFVTSDGDDPLIISRFHGISAAQGQQELRFGVGDNISTLHYINDESVNRLDVRMQNTDTETGGGADANDNIVMCIKGNKDGGKVGIGTTTPGTKLEVKDGPLKVINPGDGNVLLDLNSERNWQFRQIGTGPGTALELASIGGGGNKNFIFNTTGSVGIGTDSPKEMLQIGGDNGIRLHDGENKYLTWNSYYQSGWKYGDDNPAFLVGANYNDKRLEFRVAPPGIKGGTIPWQSGMVINQAGNVGIGTTEPETKLEVVGSAKFVTYNGSTPLIISRFHGITDLQGQQELQIGVGDSVTTIHYINDEANNRLDFRMQNTDTETGGGEDANDNTVMSIIGDKGGGKVGIGTTSPNGDLHLKANTEKPLVIENCRHNVGDLNSLPINTIIIGAVVSDLLAIYWKDVEEKKYMALIKGTEI